MRVRDPGRLTTPVGGAADGENAPRAASRPRRIHLLLGALLSGSVHTALIALILFGIPMIVLNLAREPSEADSQQNLSMALVPPEDVKDLASGAVDLPTPEPRRGSRFLADAPANEETVEKADVPTTRGAADATAKNDGTTGHPPPPDSQPTPREEQAQRVEPAREQPPQPTPPKPTPPQPVLQPSPAAQPLAPQQPVVPQQTAVRLATEEPRREAPISVQLTADTPATSKPAATAPQAAESARAQERPAGASAAPQSPPAASTTAASTTATPPPKPRTSGEVVTRLAAQLPRIAAIRAELREAEKRPPGAEVPAPEGSQPVERLQDFAEQGYGHAQFALAEMLLTGEGLPRDPKKGLALATRAALNGYLPAQILLGALAADGSVGDRNLGEADAWWTLAADNGSKQAAEAAKAIKPMLEVRDIVTSRKRQAELHKIDALLSPFSGTKLTAKAAGDKLRQAAALGDVDTVSVLLAQGADADSSDEDGRTALIEAAWRGYVNIVRALAQQGANLGQTDASGKTPLVWAAINGHADVAKVLLDAGENPDLQDDQGIDALMRAAWNDRPTVVRELLAHNANPNLRDKNGMTALDYATRYGHPAIAAALRGVTR